MKTMNIIFSAVLVLSVIILTQSIYVVSETERATSPFANFVSTFEVTPPGAAAMIMTPIANSGDVFNIFIKIKAIIGSKIS